MNTIKKIILIILSLGLIIVIINYYFDKKIDTDTNSTVITADTDNKENNKISQVSKNIEKINSNVSTEELKDILKENSVEFTTTTLVSILPTTKYVDSLEGKSAEDYYSIADDFSYYTSEFDVFLKDKKVQTKMTDSNYLIFKDGDKKYYFNTKKSPLAIFSTILFKPGKEPVLMNGVDIKGAYDDYYK